MGEIIMNIIYYDVTRLLHRSRANTPTGIDRVDINYAYYFLNNEQYEVHFIFQEKETFYLLKNKEFIKELYSKWISSSQNSKFDFVKFFSERIKQKKTNSKLLSSFSYKKEQLPLPNSIDGELIDIFIKYRKHSGIYINTSHHGVGNIAAYAAFRVLAQAKIVFYLHDIIPIDYPEYVKSGDEITHAKRVTCMALYSDYILVNSEYTKARFLSFCQKEKLTHPDVAVLHIGVEEHFIDLVSNFKPTSYFNQETNYFVYISTIEPRKNHLLLLHLWRQFALENRDNIPKLVVLGKRGWNNQNILDLLDRSTLLKDHIIELSDLSDTQMLSILKGAKALLYPSFVEGWGMPIVEAIAAKVPVVCSDIEAHRESGQNLVKYIQIDDSLTWKKTILKLTSSNELQEEILSTQSKYHFPTWNEHFIKLDSILNNIQKLNVKFPIVATDKKQTVNIVKKYCENIKCETKQIDVSSNKSRILEIIFNLAFKNKDPDRRKRLIRKFKKDPIQFMKDSKFYFIRKLGNYLDNQ